MKSIMRLLVLAFFCVALVFCGVEVEFAFEDDDSGEMTLKLQISNELLSMADSDDADMEIPLTSEELEKTYADVDGVTVVEVSQEDTEEFRNIVAVLAFDSLSALSETDEGFGGEGASLVIENGNRVFRMKMGNESEESDESEAEDMNEMVQSFLEGYMAVYRVVAPNRIKSHSHGELSNNGKTVTFGMPMAEFTQIEEPYIFEVIW